MANIKLEVAIGDYDHVRDLVSGKIAVPGIDITIVESTTTNPALALATSAAAAQGLVFASNIYDIVSPVSPPLPGGGTIRFLYDDAGLGPLSRPTYSDPPSSHLSGPRVRA